MGPDPPDPAPDPPDPAHDPLDPAHNPLDPAHDPLDPAHDPLDPARLRFGNSVWDSCDRKAVPIVYGRGALRLATPPLLVTDGTGPAGTGGRRYVTLSLHAHPRFRALLESIDRAIVGAGVQTYIDSFEDDSPRHKYAYAPLVCGGARAPCVQLRMSCNCRHVARCGDTAVAHVVLRRVMFDGPDFFVDAVAVRLA